MRNGIHLIVTLSMVALDPGHAEEDDRNPKFPEWAFCVAHVIRNADERDERPRAPETETFEKGPTRIPHGSMLRPGHVLDVASLTTRSIAQKQLDRKSTESIVSALLHPPSRFPMMDCYEPHHLFVFYTFTGEPVASIEVCLTCNRVKMSPKVKDTESPDGGYETANLLAMAKVIADAGLPLTPYKSFEEYEKSVREQQEWVENRAEQDGVGQPATAAEPESGGKEKPELESDLTLPED